MTKFMLSAMMFLEFFIWGAWLPPIFGYLGEGGLRFNFLESALVLNAFSIASITALFFSNQFADRNFAAEKFMAFSHLVGGVAMICLAFTTSFWSFFLLMLLHSLFYVPTISISNSIAFAHLKNPQKEFPIVRLWGTIGWIAAAWPFIFILVDWSRVPSIETAGFVEWLRTALGTSKADTEANLAKTYAFIVAGVASLLLAILSLALPHTPPKPAQEWSERFAWLEAARLLRRPFMLVLFLVTFLDAAVHNCYFVWTETYLKEIGIAANWVQPIMSIGQVAEIFTMAILGYFLKRFGWRTTMVIGILGHAVRFGVFALVPEQAPAILVNLLHGICYAFFFATLYIFVDEFFPKDARASAQGLFNFLILGIGPLVGFFLWPYLGEVFKTQTGKVDFQKLFLVPSAIAFLAAIFLALFFDPPERGRQILSVPDSTG